MALSSLNTVYDPSKTSLSRKIAFFAIALAMMLPTVVFGADPDGITDTGTKVCGFFQNINSLLNAASIVVVTIAVIFSGYQIAFAHKRIADVAPALIGGVLIGAAAQVAGMVVGGTGSGGSGGATACTSSSGKAVGMILDAANTAMHFLHLGV
jgi:type IV secretion system protein VirB2